MYTYAQLEAMTKVQLLELISWNGIGKISQRKKKSVIIDFILEKTYEDVVEEEPQMSVRIRRIKESSK